MQFMKVVEFYQFTHRCRLRILALGGRIGGACRLRLAGWHQPVEPCRRSSRCTGSWHPSDRFPGRRWHCNKTCWGSALPWYTEGTDIATNCCKQPALHRLRRWRGAPPCTRQPAELGTPSLSYSATIYSSLCKILCLVSVNAVAKNRVFHLGAPCIAADCGRAFIFGIWGGWLWNYGSLRW